MTRTTKLMLGLSLWLAAGVQAYVPYYTTTGQEVKWPNAQTTAVRYSINPADIGSVPTPRTFIQAVNAFLTPGSRWDLLSDLFLPGRDEGRRGGG
jgi:hypothetical protein